MEKYKQHLHITKLLTSGYNDLVISNTFRHFALSLISIFLPIFFLKKGISIEAVIYFELGILIISLILHFVINKAFNYLGVKKILILSYLTTLVFYSMLYGSDYYLINWGANKFLFVLAILQGICFSSYWMAYHHYFVKCTNKGDKGKRLGILVSVPVLLSIVSPFVGGILIVKSGFQGAFLATIILTIAAMGVLFLSKDIHIRTLFTWRKTIRLRRMKRNSLFFMEGVIFTGTGFVWPILLYQLGIEIIALGVLYLFSNAIYSAITIWSGRLIDKKHNSKIILYGAIGHGTSLIFRGLAKTVVVIMGVQGMGGFFNPMWAIPIHSLFYKNSEHDTSSSILNRELYQHLGRILTFGLVLVSITLFGISNGLLTALVVIGFSTFLVGPLSKELV